MTENEDLNDLTIKFGTPALAMGIIRILKALDSATVQHPVWPEDVVFQTAIMIEEAGKAVQEATRIKRGDQTDVTDLRSKLGSTAAMCLRALIGLEEPVT